MPYQIQVNNEEVIGLHDGAASSFFNNVIFTPVLTLIVFCLVFFS